MGFFPESDSSVFDALKSLLEEKLKREFSFIFRRLSCWGSRVEAAELF